MNYKPIFLFKYDKPNSFGYHFELTKNSVYVDKRTDMNILHVIVQNNNAFSIGDIIPICVGGIKISEAKVVKIELLTVTFEIHVISDSTPFCPEVNLINEPYYDIGNVDMNILNNYLYDLTDYIGLKYIPLNGKYKR